MIFAFGVVSTTPVHAATCSDYSANGYFGGSWFYFSSNSIVSRMVSNGELKRIFTTDANGNSEAIPDNRYSLPCVAPTFGIQTSGVRGLYLVGSGWTNAGFNHLDIVSFVNEYLASHFIFPTTTLATTTTTTTTLPPTTTTSTIPMSYCTEVGTPVNAQERISFTSYSTRPTNPIFTAYSPATWLSMTHALRVAAGAVYIPVSRGTSCSQFDSNPPATSSTLPPSSPNTVPSSSATSTVPQNGFGNATTTTTAPAFISVLVPSTSAPRTCAPKSDSLYIYSYFGMGLVTNHSGTYDAGIYGWSYDYVRNCSVANVTELRVQDKSGIRTQSGTSFSLNFNQNDSNCWRIARVSRFGQSDWSNQVCYTAPARKISIAVSKSKTSVPRGVTGAQCLDGYRTNVRTKSACSSHFGRDHWLFKPVRVGYVFTYTPKRSISNSGFATGRCVGICYGVPSAVNGLPRNTYVSGYFRKDGTYVGPYTRSNP